MSYQYIFQILVKCLDRLQLAVILGYFQNIIIQLPPVERAWKTVLDNTFKESSDVRERELVVFEVINKFKFLCCSFTTDGRGDVVTLKEKHSRLSKQLNAHSESSTTLSEIEVMFD